ncbi:HK97 family phage prohead protease [Mesorhizobium newzealandense]|uniref:HK97 family phage prohead protease n=1 Tax=Mesorhizobium newzealandense TaxID=1300302 RepID=A0ABW4UHD6_9HYPH
MTAHSIIEIPDLSRHAARAEIAAKMAGMAGMAGMANGKRAGISGHMYANHPQSTMQRPALRGIACQYGEVFDRDGEEFAFVKGCFTEALRSEIKIRIDHTEHTDFGSTAAGLRFIDGDDFLAFEYELPETQSGAVVTSMVASGGRTDVSVGARKPTIVAKTLRGRDIKLIVAAGMEEISLCADGAVRNSHVRIVDLVEAQPIETEIRNGTLRTVAVGNELATASKRLLKTAEALNAKVEPKRVARNASTGLPLASWER